MKPIDQIRRENLSALVAQEPSQAAFARKIGKDKNQVSQWLGRGSPRNLSAEIAREIEAACGKPRGWIDTDHEGESPSRSEPTSPSQSGGLDRARLDRTIKFIEQQFEVWGREFVASRHSWLIAAVYERLEPSEAPNLIVLSQWLAGQIEGEDVSNVGEGQIGSAGGHDRKRAAGRAA